MVAIGIGIVWLAYLNGLYGYCLFKGYDITMKQLMSDTWPAPKTTKKEDQNIATKETGDRTNSATKTMGNR